MFLNFFDDVLNFFKGLWEKVVEFHNGLERELQYALYAGIGLVVILIIVLIACGINKSKKKRLTERALMVAELTKEENESKVEEPSEILINEEQKENEESSQEEQVEEQIENEESSQEEQVDEQNISENTSEKEISEEEKRKVLGKYEVFEDSDFYKYRLKASNGEVLVDSEVYSSIEGAYNAIESVKKNIADGHLLITKDKNNAYQFKLLAKNHRVLVISANYSTERAAMKASESFKRFAVDASIVKLDPSEVVSTITRIKIGKVEQKFGGKIVIAKEDGVYFFKLYASNNELMCSSLDYKSKNGAISAIDTFKSAIKDGKFYVVKDKKNNYQFKLYSNANRLIALGQSYKNKTQAKQSASIVVSYVENVTIEAE